MCTNELGATHCIGCDQYFCTNDFQTHRQTMINEMDKIIEEHHHLQDEINNKAQSNDQQNSVFEQIDRWQKSTIEKVIQVATQARQQAIELLNNRRMEFKSFAQNLADIKESENYVEHDLRRLKQMINHFKQALIDSIQSTTILLHTEQSDRINWESLIYVEDQQAIVISKFISYILPEQTFIPLIFFQTKSETKISR
jgi:flagellar biosynthesis GTPase FlhF